MKFRIIPLLAAVAAAIAIGCHADAADTHSYSLKSGTYSGGQLVWLTHDEGVDLYYTTDGSEPDCESTKAEGAPIVAVKNTKIRCAAYIDGECVERSSVSIKIRTASPEASVPDGSYANAFGVTLSCADKQAKIYYTTDGSIPTNQSTPYNGTIPITEDTTLKFIAYRDGYTYSRYVTREYTITEGFADSECQWLFDMINDYREQCGLERLAALPTLGEAAQIRAQEAGVYFSHYRPNGTKWDSVLSEYGLYRNVRAENIAGFTAAQDALRFWKNSYYHNINMLNADAKYLGVGHCDNGSAWVLLIIGEDQP